jgi:hypothetical protein
VRVILSLEWPEADREGQVYVSVYRHLERELLYSAAVDPWTLTMRLQKAVAVLEDAVGLTGYPHSPELF